MLSDLHGVQARGGCACAGPYAQHLLGYDAAGWEGLRAEILAGDEMARPGFVRLNLSPLADEAEIDAILSAVADVAARAPALAALYEADPARAIFRPRAGAALTA
jgi:selenocysteine lyase/cysteine desulfurase